MKITNSQLQQIIKEEAIRLKTRMMLENEKAQILKRLQEIEECDMMEEDVQEEGLRDIASKFTGGAVKSSQQLADAAAALTQTLNASYDAKAQEFLANVQKNPQWASFVRQQPQALANMQKSIATQKPNVVKAANDRVTQNKLPAEAIIFTFESVKGGVKANFTIDPNVKADSNISFAGGLFEDNK